MMDINKFKGSILGAIIGDVLGVPVEFQSREYLSKRPVTGFQAFGTYNKPKGTWSDDSSLILCTMDSLLNGIDYNDMMRKFYLWIREAIWTATDEVFDVGITTRNAIINYQNGNSAVNCGLQDEYSNGNGSLMRILPVSFAVLKLPMERRKEICFNVSALTHAHFRSKIACWLYSEIIRNLVDDLSKNKSIDDAFNLVELWCEANYAQSEFRHFRRCNSSIESYKSDQIKSTGYVLDSLEAALYAFLNTKNYKEAVLMAVNLGEDTDTIGLITGGLAGTYYGYNEIPTDWINAILKKEKILQLIDNFYEKYKF